MPQVMGCGTSIKITSGTVTSFGSGGSVVYYPGIATYTTTGTTGSWCNYQAYINDIGTTGTTTIPISIRYEQVNDQIIYTYTNAYYSSYNIIWPPSKTISEIMRSRYAPNVIRNRKSLDKPLDIREIRARETLKRVVGEQKYINYVKNGFVTAQNRKSGLIFQIFPGHSLIKVYKKNVFLETLCVQLVGDYPPTDSVIVRYLLAINNEDLLRVNSIRREVSSRMMSINTVVQPERENLVEIYKKLKVA